MKLNDEWRNWRKESIKKEKKIHSNKKKIRTKLNIKNKWEDTFIFLQEEER
jgi:hypothetical protein